MRRSAKWVVVGVLALGVAAALVAHLLLWPGASFIATFERAEVQIAADAEPFAVEVIAIPSPRRAIPARLFWPRAGFDRALLVVHGVHPDGYDEARLLRLSRELARRSFLVLAPDLEDLRQLRLVPNAVDEIEIAARFLLDDPRLAGARLPHRPGLFGISFAGGLCLSAAARESLSGRIGAVFSFGGHGDLDHVLTYLIDGRLPDGRILPPHPYAQAVLARQYADRLVPAPQVEALRRTLVLFVQNRHEELAAAAATLPPESRVVTEPLVRWDAAALGRVLAPLAGRLDTEASLSPVRGPVPACPVFLLHGSDDNVIPPSESAATGRWAASGTETHVLVTPLIQHVELQDPAGAERGLADTLKLLRFLTRWLSVAP